MVDIKRNPTRPVRIGSVTIGAGHPIAPQSMTATHTQDVAATLDQVNALHAAGAVSYTHLTLPTILRV